MTKKKIKPEFSEATLDADATIPEIQDAAFPDEPKKPSNKKKAKKLRPEEFVTPEIVGTVAAGLDALVRVIGGPDAAMRQEEAVGIGEPSLRLVFRHVGRHLPQIEGLSDDARDVSSLVLAVVMYGIRQVQWRLARWQAKQQARAEQAVRRAGTVAAPAPPMEPDNASNGHQPAMNPIFGAVGTYTGEE